MNPFSMLRPTDQITSVPPDGMLFIFPVLSISSKYTSSSGIVTKGRTIRIPRIEEKINNPIDWTKYFSWLSLICEKAEFGDIITRKIKPRSKEDN